MTNDFGSNYPCGPCEFEGCVCNCGWVYDAGEVDESKCDDECDTCQYCGSDKCPDCGNHLHCGGCI